jgi:type I site-specific restriction endonuclease
VEKLAEVKMEANRPKLNFPEYPLSIRQTSSGEEIFDIIRKQFVALTPEEWVRQHCIHFLISVYPKELIAVEGSLKVNGMKKRFDILVYNKQLKPFLIVECKRTDVEISQKTIDQALAYNHCLNADNILLTNGINHYIIKKEDNQFVFSNSLPILK